MGFTVNKKHKFSYKNDMKMIRIFRKMVSHVLLFTIGAFTILPFLWTISTSLKGQDESLYSFPPKFIPENFTLDNYLFVNETIPIFKFFFNSVILTSFGVVLPLIFCSLAAFPLARMEFKGKNVVFMIIIATMMIPSEVTMIPVFIIIDLFNLVGTYSGVILPSAVPVLGIFLMRQAFISLPKELEESATIDGASPFRIWWSILLPMVRPMIATLAILSFINSWNNFLWPLLILDDPNTYPLTLGLYQLKGAFSTNTRMVAAGSIIALLPVIAIFILFQRYFIQGAYSSSIKG